MEFSEKYELVQTDRVDEIGAAAYLLRHKKSGARLLLLDCDDDNKVFDIAFRTSPPDDTGVPHIIEHTVLCGSDRYPVKDPFVELAKGSLNTFLNAMTFPDKTMYPVASVNDADFRNLMSVYMDAVFHPNIYKNEKIFLQEGWHYELQDRESPVIYNGVVYNEMRGAFSNPDDVLARYTLNVLFPDTAYANESGGDPEKIPELTYEAFLNFHRRYYHPSNSFIYLYGDMDFAERLQWIDEAYLSHYDAIDPKTEIAEQAPFDQPVRKTVYYGVSEAEDDSLHTFSWSRAVGGLMDPVQNLAEEVLSYALLNAPGAPIRKALLEAGIGTDIYGGYDSETRQPVFSVVAKNAKPEDLDRFEEIVMNVLREQAEKGVSKRTIAAGINNIEFSLREADYGSMPKGLIYGLQAYETWIHDDLRPLIHLKYNEPIQRLKDLSMTNYFEELIKKTLIGNPHGALIKLSPKKGLVRERDRATEEKLAAYKASLSGDELDALIQKTKELKAYQDEPSTQEELLSIPLLSVSDVKREIQPFQNEEATVAGIPTVWHDIRTSGIAYMDLRFSLDHVSYEELPLVSLMKTLMGQMDTERFTYQELNDEISLLTGGLDVSTTSWFRNEDYDHPLEEVAVRGRAVYDHIRDLMDLTAEVTLRTDFSDTARMKEIISEQRTQMQSNLVARGNATAVRRVLSYSTPSVYEDDLVGGVAYFRFLCDIEKNFDERKDGLVEKLRAMASRVFRKNAAVLSYTSEPAGFSELKRRFSQYADLLPLKDLPKAERVFERKALNEGIVTSSQVQYVACGGNFRKKGYSYDPVFPVLRTVMGYEYLWLNLRVKGGAYGCGSVFGRSGDLAFMSFRDPNLKNTADVFRGVPEYLENLKISDRDMNKYIIGTVSDLDTPLGARAKGDRSFSFYRSGISKEQLQEERERVLSATVEDLRNLAPLIRDTLSDGDICTVGSEAKLEEGRDLFGTLESLAGEKQ